MVFWSCPCSQKCSWLVVVLTFDLTLKIQEKVSCSLNVCLCLMNGVQGRPFCALPIPVHSPLSCYAVREFANKSAASAASPDYVKFQAVIKSAASAASLRGGRASGRLDHGYFVSQFLARPKNSKKSSKSRTLLNKIDWAA